MTKSTKANRGPVPVHALYIVQVEGPEYWLHTSKKTRAQLMMDPQLLKGAMRVERITDGVLEPYAMIKFGCDLSILTWREYQASGIKEQLVHGLERWREPGHTAEPERPKKPHIEDPSDPVETFLGAKLPDHKAQQDRPMPALKTPDPDTTATPKLLAALAEMPGGVNTDTLACKVYGDASVRSKSKLYNLLSYHTRKKTVRKTKLGLWKLQDMVERAADAILDAQVGL